VYVVPKKVGLTRAGLYGFIRGTKRQIEKYTNDFGVCESFILILCSPRSTRTSSVLDRVAYARALMLDAGSC
jgi:hypothetical protein